MFEWINENAVFFAAIGSLIGIVIGALITSKTSLKIEHKKGLDKVLERLEHENEKLLEKNTSLNEQLSKLESIEEKEKYIDKSLGSAYIENFSNGTSREICGFCWETKRQSIPITTSINYDSEPDGFHYGLCRVCREHCCREV